MKSIGNYLKSNAWQLTTAFMLVIALSIGVLPHEAVAGAGVFVALSTSAFPINPELSAIAIAFSNPAEQLIADQVLPRVPTAQKFKYTKYSVEQGYTVPDTKVGRKSEPNMVDFGGTEITLETVDYGLDDLVPVSDSAAWDAMQKPSTGGPLSPIALSVMMLTNLVALDREIRVAGTVFNTNAYSAGNQQVLSGTGQWNDFANSNPLDNILTALDIPLVRPNTMVIGQQAITKLRQHPKIVNAIGGSSQGSGNASLQQIAELLGVRNVYVGGAFLNTARKGQAPSYQRAWGKHCALLHIDSLAAQLQQPTFGWTAQFGDRIAGVIPSPVTGLRGGDRVRSGESVQEVIVSQEAGYFFQNVVA